MDRLNVGVVGVGIGRAHLRGYQQLNEEVNVAALCDVNEVRLNEVADEYNIKLRYTDYQEMFSSGNIEAVSICLPNSLHAPVAISALEAGLHVLCEKPLAENVESGQKVVEAAQKASGKFMMCFNRRYRADIQWMKQALDEGMLGTVYQVKAGWIRETGIPSGWFTNKEMAGGGPLIDLGVHMLDAVLWLLDYPKAHTVTADVKANFGPKSLKYFPGWRNKPGAYTVEDLATAFIRLESDVALYLETSWASHDRPGMDDIYITLYGTEGTLKLYIENYANEHTLTLYSELGGIPTVSYPKVKGVQMDHQYAVGEFVKMIQEDTPPTASVEQGQMVMQIIDAIYRSAEVKREIALEL